MAIQLSVAARNALLDAVETAAGATAHLKIYTGTIPADCAAAATGTLLVDMALPSDWMNAASSGSKTLLGTWQVTATTGGTAGYFRITDTAGTNCHIQGTIGTDMTLDNTSINSGQTVTITSFTLTAPNA